MTPKRYSIYDTKTRLDTAWHATTLHRARAIRRGLNKTAGDPLRFIVIPGPDHKKYKGAKP